MANVKTVENTPENEIRNVQPITLTDTKDRHIIVPADALGYAIIGSETRHAVGFGALN